ncbi:hypothetical protein [Thalassotalea sp. G2M2-11]|uniref:hypothetical protein n=1 Tax=Thalassotalea sp. G2M2-11 TaxID=2787627 RepID=UPI0019D17A72|nr:hypothetical protein [Thalassotalea sp. G2M2-11]
MNIKKKSQVNKKLWSFNIGCLLAYAFLWLVNIGHLAPVPELLHAYPTFILDYYPSIFSSGCALIATLAALYLMNRGLNICASEHTFWLLLPSFSLIVLTGLSANERLTTMLISVLPSLTVLTLIAVFYRLSQQRVARIKKCAV